MMITAVTPRHGRSRRLDVHIDGAYAFDVAKKWADQLDLRVGRRLDRPDIERILAEDRQRSALDTAVALLARRPHAEREIRRRLARHRFPPEVIDHTLERLSHLNLIDDAEFARARAESRNQTSPRSRRMIERELQREVDHGTAAAAVTALSDDDAAYRLATSKRRAFSALDQHAFRTRLQGLLLRRGFDWDTVHTTINRCWAELRAGSTVDSDERNAVG